MQSNLKREDLPEFLVSVRQLAEDSKKKLKETRGISLTYRLQLKDDIKAVSEDMPAEKGDMRHGRLPEFFRQIL